MANPSNEGHEVGDECGLCIDRSFAFAGAHQLDVRLLDSGDENEMAEPTTREWAHRDVQCPICGELLRVWIRWNRFQPNLERMLTVLVRSKSEKLHVCSRCSCGRPLQPAASQVGQIGEQFFWQEAIYNVEQNQYTNSCEHCGHESGSNTSYSHVCRARPDLCFA